MTYCTRADIEDLLGERNVAMWSNLDPDATEADEARIELAIGWASNRINERMAGGVYQVPLAPVAGSALTGIRHACAMLAGWWLFSSRGLPEAITGEGIGAAMAAMRRDAERQLDRYRAGIDHLPAQRAPGRADVPTVVGD